MTSSAADRVVDIHRATDRAEELAPALTDIYSDVYAEPPYLWGKEHTSLFVRWFAGQRVAPGFDLVVARADDEIVGFAFGVTLRPDTPWWSTVTTPVDADLVTETPGRTFALVELLVRRPWRRRGVARRLHDQLLEGRPEQRATLTVLPEAEPAQRAYRAWGWQWVAQKANPLPGEPVFDVMIKPLRPHDTHGPLAG